MTPEMAIQSLFNGMMLALIYILIALGLTLVFGIMRIVNFAHGEMYMLGGMFTYHLATGFGLNYFLALVVSILLLVVVGVILERICFRPIQGNFDAAMVVGLGLGLILQSSALLVFGIEDKSFPSPFHGVIHVFGATMAVERLAIVPFAIVLVVCLLLFVGRTKAGKAMQAVAQDIEAAQLQGIDSGKISALSMAVGAALAGAAGGLIMPIFITEPFIGGPALMKAFVIIVVGGMGSIGGVIFAGLILGFIDSFGAILFGGPMTSIIGFLLLIAVILIKPTGLMGHGE
jgi:branched-chain amino acid transport system permease protein